MFGTERGIALFEEETDNGSFERGEGMHEEQETRGTVQKSGHCTVDTDVIEPCRSTPPHPAPKKRRAIIATRLPPATPPLAKPIPTPPRAKVPICHRERGYTCLLYS
jgi:hypothetical protein